MGESKSVLAWHFTGAKLHNGEPIPAQGEWLEFCGTPIMCTQGLHASLHPYDALKYAPGLNLHRVRLDGEIHKGDDKLVATRRKIIWTLPESVMQPLMWDFARHCALSVIHLWDAPDVVKQYLETGNESLRAAARAAARNAAWNAAWAAAWAAARNAALNAARAAAWDTIEGEQRKYLLSAIMDQRKATKC